MKSTDIVSQLVNFLPQYTNLFSDDISITSLTRSGITVTAITSTAHGLSTGSWIYITGAITPVTISSLTRINNIATAVTASNHDLTLGYQETVTISGATQIEYNGEHTLTDVQNRRTFSYSLTGTPVTPATGSPKIYFNLPYGYNGLHQITVIDTTTFTYQIESEPESPAVGAIVCRKNIRISDCITLERAIESYTKQGTNKLWAFIMIGAHSANKDRRENTDATYIYNMGVDYRQFVIQPFTIYVFVPSITSISGTDQRNLMEDLAQYLFKSVLRFNITNPFDDQTNFGSIFTGHGMTDYNTAFYVHEFNFEIQYYLSYNDTIDPTDNVAFRDIRLKFSSYLQQNAGIIMDTNVDLDNEPL